MFLRKPKSVYLFVFLPFVLLASAVIYAVGSDEVTSTTKDKVSLRVSSRDKEEIALSERNNRAYGPWKWGNDVTIATGLAAGGISATYDLSGNMYAARCDTFNGIAQNKIRFYKSTDGGHTWPSLNNLWGGTYSRSYPQLLTCEKGDSTFLYVFYMVNDPHGVISLYRFTLNGSPAGLFTVVSGGADTITYYSACSDLDGDTVLVAYEIHKSSAPSPMVNIIRSTDYGVTWSWWYGFGGGGTQPDIAYGAEGRVFVAFRDLSSGHDIQLRRSTNYGTSWGLPVALTNDEADDSYPKVAALHTSPPGSATLWVAYNHESLDPDTLRHDDDTAHYYFNLPDQYGDNLFNVRFTPTVSCRLDSAQLLFHHKAGTGAVRIYVWADTSGYPAKKIDSVDLQTADIRLSPNWTTVDFWSKNITLTGASDFHIGYAPLGSPATDTLSILSDDGLPTGSEHRSSEFSAGTWGTIYHDWGIDANFMIRAVVEKVVSMDLRCAYSTDGGDSWTKGRVIADSSQYNEMATDLEVYRTTSGTVVDLCYFKSTTHLDGVSDVYYTWAYSSAPGTFHAPHEKMNDHYAYLSSDAREVCQLTYPSSGLPGIVYSGAVPLMSRGENPYVGAWNLFFDYYPWTDVSEDIAQEETPAQFSLSSNYPNPFNPETKIGYFLPQACHVRLDVYNILGQKVRTLVDGERIAGKGEVFWDGNDEKGDPVASGIYFYKFQTKDFTQTKKMVLIR
jgi:hypothetical protein